MATSVAISLHIADSFVMLFAPESIVRAAVWTSWRAASICVAMSANIHCTPWNELTGCPNCCRPCV
jgi:hypothetical protein